MIEDILVWILVAAALLFLIRHFSKLTKSNAGCGNNCSCPSIDWKAIEKRALQEKE